MKHGANRFSVVTAAMAALAITEKIEGTIKVDVSDPEDSAPEGADGAGVRWMLKKKAEEGYVHYYLVKGLTIFLR